MMEPLPFGKYLLLDRIAAGGMAEVYRAKAFGAEGFERILAIKRILPNMAEDAEFINMFVDEARIAVRLTHPNIVQIHELGKFNDQYYMAMEYVAGTNGRDLFQRITKGNLDLPVAAAAYIICNVCDALDYAHRKTDPAGRPMNVVHRDVSPQNVLISFDGQVKVTDFGIAKAEDRVSEKTQAGVLKGKFSYMAPEQVRGMVLDRRADVFAVGILLYELVTGQRLFKGKGDLATLEMVRSAKVTPPSQIRDIPPDLEQIILKSLALDKEERYQWASDLHDDLERFLIADASIFNAKRLAALMQDSFKPELDAEMARMERFASMSGPSSKVAEPAPEKARPEPVEASVALTAKARPQRRATENAVGEREIYFDEDTGRTDRDQSQAVGPPPAGDRTVVFASQELEADLGAEDADSTRIEEGPSGWGEDTFSHATRSDDATMQENDAAFVSKRPRTHTEPKVQPQRVEGQSSKPRPHPMLASKRGVAAIAAAAGALLITLVVLVVVLVDFGASGTVIITSSPTQQVNLVLDDELIAEQTPFTSHDVPLGTHTLTVSANGYKPRAFQFQLGRDAPAVINLELEPMAPAVAGAGGAAGDAAVAGTGDAAVVASPTGAAGATGAGGAMAANTAQTPEAGQPGAGGAGAAVDTATPDTTTTAAVTPDTTGTPPHDPPPSPQEASVRVESDPPGGTVYYRGVDRGVTPTTLTGLDPAEKVVLGVVKPGYDMTYTTVTFEGGLSQSVTVRLKAKSSSSSASSSSSSSSSSSGSKCTGTNGQFSLMAIGASNCKVKVGSVTVGMAPFFKKSSPSGNCPVIIACSEGKTYRTTMNIPAGEAVKLIVRPEMWK